MRTIDEVLERFEQSWDPTNPPSFTHYLKDFLDDGSLRLATLAELVCVDIEFRWKRTPRGTRGLVLEDYFKTHPELGVFRDAPILLVEEEYRARRSWGDSPSISGYVNRFGDRGGQIQSALRRIDAELKRESVGVFEVPRIDKTLDVRDESLPTFNDSDFLLHQMIGFGHMGRVYRATNKADGRTAAVKFLRKAFCRDLSAVNRFRREARMVHGLNDVGIVRVDGVGTTPNAGHFLVMELLSGPDLASVIRREQVEIRQAVKWTIQAAQAISYANEAGIFHCDLKPGNLVLDAHGNVKITDFGLATCVDESNALDRIAGTAPYMAPEQVSRWWGEIGRHTDVYGLGAVLYALLTGRPPYTGASAADILSHVVSGQEPPRPAQLRAGIGPALSDVVGKALAKQPGQRFQSAADFMVALQAVDKGGTGD